MEYRKEISKKFALVVPINQYEYIAFIPRYKDRTIRYEQFNRDDIPLKDQGDSKTKYNHRQTASGFEPVGP